MRLGLTNENGRDHQDEKSHYSALCKTALNNFVTGFQATLNLKYTIEEYTVRCKRFAISNFKENYPPRVSVDHLLPIIVILFH